MRLALAALVLVGLAARGAGAHPLDLGLVNVTHDGPAVTVAFELDVATAHAVVGGPALDAATTPARAAELAARLVAAAPITTPAGPCAWGAATARLDGRTVKLATSATCTGDGARTWTFPFLRDPHLPRTFQLMLQEGDRVTVLDATTDTVPLVTAAHPIADDSFLAFLWSGIEHIGAAPSEWHDDTRGLHLPDGIDHILFLIALMLGGGTVWRLVGIASGFTLGHSITLALAALDVVRPPPSLIEPIIALSIALVALEAFTSRFERHRWKLATGFGLVHGFGFAYALTELQLSTGTMVKALFGYNLGVELGQIAVVLVIAPLVLLLRKQPRWGLPAIRAIAAAIAALGLYWFIARAFG